MVSKNLINTLGGGRRKLVIENLEIRIKAWGDGSVDVMLATSALWSDFISPASTEEPDQVCIPVTPELGGHRQADPWG